MTAPRLFPKSQRPFAAEAAFCSAWRSCSGCLVVSWSPWPESAPPGSPEGPRGPCCEGPRPADSSQCSWERSRWGGWWSRTWRSWTSRWAGILLRAAAAPDTPCSATGLWFCTVGPSGASSPREPSPHLCSPYCRTVRQHHITLDNITWHYLKRRCAEWSVYDIKVPRERFESIRIRRSAASSRTHLLCLIFCVFCLFQNKYLIKKINKDTF